MGDAIDPDLAVVEGAFEAFAEAVVAVLGLVPGAEAGVVTGAAVADEAGGATGTTEATEAGGPVEGGSVIAGEGADALYTLPDGSISFSGYGMDGTSYSFGVD